MKKSIVMATLVFANCLTYAQSSAQISELDLSNEIELPGCSLNIKFKIKRGMASRDWQALGIRSLDKVTVFQISLNGKRVAMPADFGYWRWVRIWSSSAVFGKESDCVG